LSRTVFLEAEGFADIGGWALDQQFMDQMGSPYLLAHGLGQPVADAVTTVEIPEASEYRVWVRTKDWVAPWNAPGAPGSFQLLVDGTALDVTFGTEGAQWHWQFGGTVEVPAGKVALALHDLTGFEGRCDAIILSADPDFVPPEGDELVELRKRALGLAAGPDDAGEFDLVVVGGGIAGVCATLSAARLGLTVALVHDRPVLGGNNSSEVRVWLGGETNIDPYPRVGDIVRELEPEAQAHYGPENGAELYEDAKRIEMVRGQKGVTLFLSKRAVAAETEDGRAGALVTQDIRTGERRRLRANLFADCTGDGEVGFLAGAEHEMTLKGHMGPTNVWHVADAGRSAPFPKCPWALDLSDKPFPVRGDSSAESKKPGLGFLGAWFWESGFDRDPIKEAELIRDWNFRAMYGAWDALKNVDGLYPNHELRFAAYVAGKRESRRLMGDVVLTEDDIVSGAKFEDACVPCTWSIDIHWPDEKYREGFEGNEFISRAVHGDYKRPYWIPYRCLYSANIPNLFMAGRDISVTHEALGTVRVMRTCGMMGEVVGMAASICAERDCDPRDVYGKYLAELLALMRRGVGKDAGLSGPEREGNA
jgi:hypothetical protein